jgi:hypothetical protein
MRTIFISVLFSIIVSFFCIFFCSPAVAFTTKIDDIFSFSYLSYYPPIQKYSDCYLNGEIINNSQFTFENVAIIIYLHGFSDNELWRERIHINIIEPSYKSNNRHSFSKRLKICNEPSNYEFSVSGLQHIGNRNEEYFSGIMQKKGDLKRVDQIQLSTTSEKDKSFSFSILYSNIHWEGWSVTCYCSLYENNGSLIEPVKGSQITKLIKKLHKSSQTIYMDIPSYYNTFNTRSGIIECQIKTDFNVLKADNTVLFSKYNEKSTLNNNPQKTIQSEPPLNSIPKNTANDLPHKYEIVLNSGKILFATSYQKQDNVIHISNNDGKFNVNLNSVKEIREINQPQTDTVESTKEQDNRDENTLSPMTDEEKNAYDLKAINALTNKQSK